MKSKLKRVSMLFSHGSKKRGISTIIATVLIVLMTVAGVSLLWVGVYPLIQQIMFVEDVNVQFDIERSEYTQYDSLNDLLSVRVERGSDDADVVGVKIVLVDGEGNSHSYISYDVVEANSKKVYRFTTSGILGVDSLGVVPIYEVSGDEKEGSAVHGIDSVPTSDLSGVIESFIGFGYNSSCEDLFVRGVDVDGVYSIDPNNDGNPFDVYCDMTTDGGGWTLMISNYGSVPANMFTTTSVNRDYANNVSTNLTINNGVFWNHMRWGPASSLSTSFSDVNYPVYNERSSGLIDWFKCIGQGCSAFSPAVKFKCTWGDSYSSVGVTDSVYSTPFLDIGWNLPNYFEVASSWDAIIPGIHLGVGITISDTHNINGYECNPGDVREYGIQLWVK